MAKRTSLLINGYGRIGRVLHRILLQSGEKEIQVLGINSRAGAASHAHLLKYDSTYGVLKEKVTHGQDWLKINGQKIKVYDDKNPGKINFRKEGIDLVAECTGVFRDRENCERQLSAGAKKVIISAPGKDEDISIVLGVNHHLYRPQKHQIVSNASCTTNALAMLVKVIQAGFGLRCAQLTTIHSLTLSQNLLDKSHHKNMRIARAAVDSFIPSTTGASKAIGLIFPELKGCFNALSVRVPFSTVSLIDLVAQLKKPTTADKLNQAFRLASRSHLKNYLGFSQEPLVSIDYKGEPCSAVVDGLSTNVIGQRLVKVLAWYDNEWGYTSRLYDLLKLISKSL
ncbi:type I glyceraldehyde-3-phosphate dehydrogenase [Patescibacteria group bacterium]